MITSDYAFGSINRLSYGIENPNVAGLIVAFTLPAVWLVAEILEAKESRRGMQGFWWIIECFLWFLVAFTYSRGAFCALFTGVLIYTLGRSTGQRLSDWWRSNSAFLYARVSVSVVVVIASGLAKRFVDIAGGDSSASNRLFIWRDAAKLLAMRPQGWGIGNASAAYLQWAQDPEKKFGVADMANSYLTVGVEFGVVPLCVLIVFFCTCFIISVKSAYVSHGSRSSRFRAYGAMIAIFLVGSAFSSVWTNSGVLTGLAILVATLSVEVIAAKRFIVFPSAIFQAVVLGVSITGVLYAAGFQMVKSSGWELRELAPGINEFRRAENPKPVVGDTLVFLPDERVLGFYYAKQIRLVLPAVDQRIRRIVIVSPGKSIGRFDGAKVVVFGRRLQEMTRSITDAGSVVAVFPLGHRAPGFEPSVKLLILPECDEFGYAAAWRIWAKSQAVEVKTIPGVDQNAGWKWPLIWETIQNAES